MPSPAFKYELSIRSVAVYGTILNNMYYLHPSRISVAKTLNFTESNIATVTINKL